MHFHMRKHETMYCLKGAFHIFFCNTEFGTQIDQILNVGDSIVIQPGQPHRIVGLGIDMNELIEFSTHHEDEDSYRVEPARKPSL